MYKSVILAEQHIAFVYHGFAIVNALALGKVMLVAKDLHLGERFDDAPLIYPTLIKSAPFAVVLACFKILEDHWPLSWKVLRREHCRFGWRHTEGNPDSDAARVRGAHSFRRIRRTRKSSWQGQIGSALFPSSRCVKTCGRDKCSEIVELTLHPTGRIIAEDI